VREGAGSVLSGPVDRELGVAERSLAGFMRTELGPQTDRRERENGLGKPTRTLLPDTFVLRAQPGTRGKTRVNAEACRGLFPAFSCCSRHAGPQRDRSGGSCGPFGWSKHRIGLMPRGVLSADEKAAGTIIARYVGGTVVPRDVPGAPDGTHDLDITLPRRVGHCGRGNVGARIQAPEHLRDCVRQAMGGSKSECPLAGRFRVRQSARCAAPRGRRCPSP
jgi:hypothetical protein